MSHPDLVLLGAGDDGRDRYTTRSNYELESQLGDWSQALFLDKNTHQKDYDKLNSLIAKHQLNSEQADALLHLSEGKKIAAIVGRAGTGKSYLMSSANELWQSQGFNVTGMAVSSVAAKGLQKDSGITSKTIAHYKQLIQHDAWHLNEKSIVVMDEAGMTDLHDMATILRYVHESRASLVLVGDHAQLQPIGIGAPFRSIVEMIGFAEMNRIMRQVDEKDCLATLQLSKGNIQDAINHYDSKNQMHLMETEIDAKNALISDWQSHLKQNDLAGMQKQLILAHANDDVMHLNLLARDCLIKNNLLDQNTHTFKTEKGEITLAVNDRVLFLKNDKDLNISNGDFATITEIKDKTITAKLNNDKTVTFNAENYTHFTYGYAATIHKTQGVTLDNTFVYVKNNYWDRYLTYVALSRHKNYVGLYASIQSFKNKEKLIQNLSRDGIKDTVLDFSFAFPTRRGFNIDTTLGRFINTVSELKEKIKDRWQFVTNYESYIKLQHNRDQFISKQETRERARIVSEFIDLHRATSKEWSQIYKATKSETIDKKDLLQNKNYQQLIKDTLYKNALAKKISGDMTAFENALTKNGISKEIIEKAAIQFDAQRSFNVDIAAKKAAEKIAEIDKKIASINKNKVKEKDQDIER